MRVASVTNEGVKIIVYKDGDYYYENGDRVPDNLRTDFKNTIFRDPSKMKRELTPDQLAAELEAFCAGVRERARQGLLKKPEVTNN
jgi:hypothetical protein